MKRPEITTALGPVNMQRETVVSNLLDFFLLRYGGTLRSAYAKVTYNTEDACLDIDAADEKSDLKGRDDLLSRLSRDQGCMWSCAVNTKFAYSDIYVVIFSDIQEPSQTNVVISLEPSITRFLEDEDVARVPYILFLEEISQTVRADWFLSGLHIYNLTPLSLSCLIGEVPMREKFGADLFPYVLAWKQGILNEQKLLQGWGLNVDDIKLTLQGFCFISLFPNW